MFAVHMDQPPRPRAFVQIIDILRHNGEHPRPVRIQRSERPVRGIGLRGLDVGAALIVKAEDQIGVTRKGFGRGDIFYAVLFPQAAFIPKGADAAFCADARAGQDHDVADGIGVEGHANVLSTALPHWA